MPRRGALFWSVVIVALLGALVYLPAYLARASTAQHGSIDFLTHPQDGWRFMLDATQDVPGARAGDPAAARRLAIAAFRSGGAQAVRVDLLFLPDRWTEVGIGQGTRRLATNATLVWRVTGRTRPGGPLRTIGLIDMRSGDLLYDARND